MKTFKTSLVLLSTFVLAACGQKASNSSATETTQVAQATTAAQQLKPIINHQKINRPDNKQSNANSNQQVTAPFQRW